MNTTQIYQLINDVNSQAFGENALAVADAQGLISLGSTVLNSTNNTEAFLNTLVQRIGRTIVSFRAYRNKFADMVRNDFEWGAILQKIRVHMPDAQSDPAYSLTDGQSVDPWTVYKPDVEQKLFVTRTPYMFAVSIARDQLKEAFTGESAMGAFISAIFGQVRNALEVSLENLGRLAINNMIAETTPAGTTPTTINHEITLVSDYNTERSLTGTDALTAATALNNSDFLRYAVARIKSVSDYFTDMGALYNDGSIETFTPRENQRLKVLSDFERRLETVVQYSAFNEEMVRLDAFDMVNFWQAQDTTDSRDAINITRASDGEAVTKSNIVAVLFDVEALGMYRRDEDVLTTPVNAKGLYYNTFYHLKQLWFNDLSENFVYFTLN